MSEWMNKWGSAYLSAGLQLSLLPHPWLEISIFARFCFLYSPLFATCSNILSVPLPVPLLGHTLPTRSTWLQNCKSITHGSFWSGPWICLLETGFQSPELGPMLSLACSSLLCPLCDTSSLLTVNSPVQLSTLLCQPLSTSVHPNPRQICQPTLSEPETHPSQWFQKMFLLSVLEPVWELFSKLSPQSWGLVHGPIPSTQNPNSRAPVAHAYQS
jgi:hypothetical protein